MKQFFFIFALGVCVLFLTHPTKASDIAVNYDGPTMIDLNDDAATVIVGNPEHAKVILDTPRRLLVTAGQPGMTRLMVLDRNGQVILNRNMVVGNGGGNGNGSTIRIRNACVNGGENCQENRIYHCAEGQRCNAMMVPNSPTSNGGATAPAGQGPIAPPMAPAEG